jgi:hypothetical protein
LSSFLLAVNLLPPINVCLQRTGVGNLRLSLMILFSEFSGNGGPLFKKPKKGGAQRPCL